MNSPEQVLSPQHCFALQIHSSCTVLFANVGVGHIDLCRSFKTFLNSIRLITNIIHEFLPSVVEHSQLSPQIFTVLGIDPSSSIERKLSKVP